MDKLSSPQILKGIIGKHGFRFNKNLGQNFLIDSNILQIIAEASAMDKDACVIEIGPGVGVLTQVLAEKSKKVIAIEIDSHLIPILEETLSGYNNVKIINKDILKVDMNKLISEEFDKSEVKVIANLPYYITTPIIMNLLENRINLSSIIVMVQKEVAERFVASPGGKDYGAISLAVQYYTQPRIIAKVPPDCFMPRPKVESMIVRLDVLSEPPVKANDEKKFFSVIKAAFGQRRKTLINALYNSGLFKMSKDEMKELLNKIGLKDNCRGETLSITQFSELSNSIF